MGVLQPATTSRVFCAVFCLTATIPACVGLERCVFASLPTALDHLLPACRTFTAAASGAFYRCDSLCCSTAFLLGVIVRASHLFRLGISASAYSCRYPSTAHFLISGFTTVVCKFFVLIRSHCFTASATRILPVLPISARTRAPYLPNFFYMPCCCT